MTAPDVSAEEIDALATQVSNWGRWGDDDQRGTLNLLDGAAVQRGLACVKAGKSFSLAIPFDEAGPQLGNIPGRDNPRLERQIVHSAFSGSHHDAVWNDDSVHMGVQAATHWDALAHTESDHTLYNNVAADTIDDERGATRLGVEHVGPVVGRAIVLDFVRALGHDDRLPPVTELTAADLDVAVEQAGIVPEPGDILLVRTGQMAVWRSEGKEPYSRKSPGLGLTTVPWLRERDIAAVATDTLTFEPVDADAGDWRFPVQKLLGHDMGLLLGQLWDLDALADDCAADGAYGVLLVANPLPLTGAFGGPSAPVALK